MSKPEQIRAFVDSFQSLLNANRKDVDRIKRESRLLSIRYKLTLDLRVSIETEYSDTKTPDVRECYERLFKFLDLWNVYEICMSYGERLGMTSKSHEWNSEFLNEDGIKEFLTAQEGAFKNSFLILKRMYRNTGNIFRTSQICLPFAMVTRTSIRNIFLRMRKTLTTGSCCLSSTWREMPITTVARLPELESITATGKSSLLSLQNS